MKLRRFLDHIVVCGFGTFVGRATDLLVFTGSDIAKDFIEPHEEFLSDSERRTVIANRDGTYQRVLDLVGD